MKRYILLPVFLIDICVYSVFWSSILGGIYYGFDLVGFIFLLALTSVTLAGIIGLIRNRPWYRFPLMIIALITAFLSFGLLYMASSGWQYYFQMFLGYANLAVFVYFSGAAIAWFIKPRKKPLKRILLIITIGAVIACLIYFSRNSFPADAELYSRYENSTPLTIDAGGTISFMSEGFSGSVNVYAISTGGKLKWKVPLEGSLLEYEGVPEPLAVGHDGTVYAALILNNKQGALYAIKPDGKFKWKFHGKVPKRTPAIGPDRSAFYISEDGQIIALTSDGEKKWTYPADNCPALSVAIGPDGCVYFASLDRNLHALSPEGKEKWVYETGFGLNLSSPTVGKNGTIYSSFCDTSLENENNPETGALIAVNPDGSKKWEFKKNGTSAAPLLDSNGTMYFISNLGAIYALNDDGSQRWAHERENLNYNFLLKGPDDQLYLYTGDHNFEIYKLAESGKYENFAMTTWSDCLCPVAGNNRVFYGGEKGIYVARP